LALSLDLTAGEKFLDEMMHTAAVSNGNSGVVR
jgi:hypothetical protein